MRRPIRTRRLTIAALVSITGALVIAGADVRSLWASDQWDITSAQGIGLDEGCIIYWRWSGKSLVGTNTDGIHPVGSRFKLRIGTYEKQVFSSSSMEPKCFYISVPLWLPLPLLTVIAAYWLIARPANAPAFPVFAKQS